MDWESVVTENTDRPTVPYGSPDDWYWEERNEWGFEGWVPEEFEGDEVWSNFFGSAVDFGTGIKVMVWQGAPYDSESLDYVVPSMSDEELVEWLEVNTNAFELQAIQDGFFAEVLRGFRPVEGEPAGVWVFRFVDYDTDRLEVYRTDDGVLHVWCSARGLLLDCSDLCELKRVFDERLERNWSSVQMDDERAERWDACG